MLCATGTTGAARCTSAVHTQGVSADIPSAHKGYRPDTPKRPGENTGTCLSGLAVLHCTLNLVFD